MTYKIIAESVETDLGGVADIFVDEDDCIRIEKYRGDAQIDAREFSSKYRWPEAMAYLYRGQWGLNYMASRIATNILDNEVTL